MTLLKLTFLGLSLTTSLPVFAKDVVLNSPQERMDYIRRADTWKKPSWIRDDLSFDPSFDIKTLPLSGSDSLLTRDHVACQMTEELATEDRGLGRTPKFKCLLMQYNHQSARWEVLRDSRGKTRKIKVKYNSPEVQGEVMATRLFWALGFAADKMFPVKQVSCFGCSADPFNVRQLDQSSLTNPRVFGPVSIEDKIEGEEIKITEEDLAKPAFVSAQVREVREGWSYDEALGRRSYSTDANVAREQVIERDALILLGGMLRHTDNKSMNQRLLCEGNVSDSGQCLGATRLMIQDLGYTFGWGQILAPIRASRVELGPWKRASIWITDDQHPVCTVNYGLSWNMMKPVVVDEARVLLGTLLKKFSEGEAGRKRVEDMFKVSGVEEAGLGAVSEWTEAFMAKVAEVNNPELSRDESTGSIADRFPRRNREIDQLTCQKTANDVVRRLRN